MSWDLQDILFSLVAIYNTTKNDNLKATAASSISRLLRSKVSLINALLDKYGVAFMSTGEAGPWHEAWMKG
jgi:hypothetical protein